MQFHVTWVILVTASLVNGFAANETIYTSILSDLLKFYHTDCMFLFFSTQKHHDGIGATKARSEMELLINLQKKAINGYSATAVVDITKVEMTKGNHQCRRNRPLNVLLQTDSVISPELRVAFRKCSSSSARWLLFIQSDNIHRTFRKVDIPFDCEVLVAQFHETQIQVTEIYRVNRTLPLQIRHWGTWNHKEGLHGPRMSIYYRRNDLHGAEVKVLHVKAGNDGADTVAEAIIDYLQSGLNFSYYPIMTYETKVGSMNDSSSWDGWLGYLQRDDVDIIRRSIFMKSTRMDVATFSQPLVISRSEVFIKRPEEEEYSWRSYLKPFTPELWLAVVICILIVSMTMNVIHCTGRRTIRYFGDPRFLYSFTDCLHYTAGTFCLQGHWKTPYMWSARVIYLMSYFLSVIVFSAYSAKLIAFLAVKGSPEMPFTNLQGLLDDGTYTVAVRDGGAHFDYFNATNNPVLRKIYTLHLQANVESLPTTFIEGFESSCTRKNLAFVGSHFMHRFIKRKLSCQLVHLQDEVFPFDLLSLALRKGCPYTRTLLRSIGVMKNSGVLERSLLAVTPKDMHNTAISAVSVTLSQVSSIFTMWLMTTVVSMIVFLTRKILHHRFWSKESQTRKEVYHKDVLHKM